MRSFEYAVTFEYDEMPPKLVRGTVQGSGWRVGFRRAVDAAWKEAKRSRPCSMHVLLLKPAQDVNISAQLAA